MRGILERLVGQAPPNLDFPAIPYASYLYCGICGEPIHITLPDEFTRFDWAEVETLCETHLRENHARRFGLYRRLGWRWLIAGLAP